MSALEKAIRAACAADPNFVLNRHKKLSGRCADFIDGFPDAGSEALYIHAQQKPAWVQAKPETRAAWEIFRATLKILRSTERQENEKVKTAAPRAPISRWMIDGGEDEFPRLNERIV
jgi:hypothetical protein